MHNKEKTINQLFKEIGSTTSHLVKPKQIFDDFIQLLFNKMVSPELHLFVDPYVYLYVDKQLIKEIATYKNYPKAFELLNQASSLFLSNIASGDPFSDSLGEMYDEHLGDVLGQFLTPRDISELLTELTLAIEPTKPSTETKYIADDMGCGSGANLLSILKGNYLKYGKEYLQSIHIVGKDIDYKMVQLATIQIIANSIMHKLPIKALEMHWGCTLSEYTHRKNGENTLAVKWIPKHFYLKNEINALNKVMSKVNSELQHS